MGGNNSDNKNRLQLKLDLSKIKLRLKLHSLDLKSSNTTASLHRGEWRETGRQRQSPHLLGSKPRVLRRNSRPSFPALAS